MSKVVINAEDLYFLSRVMKAKYIDYDYFKMVSELTSRFALKESHAIEHLSDKGLVYEDFTGDIEIEDLGKDLFEPIFFGESPFSVGIKKLFLTFFIANPCSLQKRLYAN